MKTTEDSSSLIRDIRGLEAPEILSILASRFPGRICFSSSLGLEDQVLTNMIWSRNLPVAIFTLDTGRLFPETYSLMERNFERYGKRIRVLFPETQALEQLLAAKGPNSFYQSVENRLECCRIRKVEPLGRALAGMDCWLTGIRREQSPQRQDLLPAEWDPVHRLVKVHPLLDWSLEQVRQYIKDLQVPYNPLHDQGFPSLGCAPCTRALRPGEDLRAGRWWWEDQSKKECGLHMLASDALPVGEPEESRLQDFIQTPRA